MAAFTGQLIAATARPGQPGPRAQTSGQPPTLQQGPHVAGFTVTGAVVERVQQCQRSCPEGRVERESLLLEH